MTCDVDLLAMPGIGPWTADYVSMRVTRAPDVLLTGDLALRNGAERLGPAGLTGDSGARRPLGSLAQLRLDASLARRIVDVRCLAPTR